MHQIKDDMREILSFFLANFVVQLSNFIISLKCNRTDGDNNCFKLYTCIICTRVVYGEDRLIIAFRRERPECAPARYVCVCLYTRI
jgi:hypothetical protein